MVDNMISTDANGFVSPEGDEYVAPVEVLIENGSVEVLVESIAAAVRLGFRDITVTTTVKSKSAHLPMSAKYHLSCKKLTEGSRALRSTRTA